MRLQLALLGGFRAFFEPGDRPVVLPTRKAQALLAYLASPPGRVHPRDKLASLLWGDTREREARTSLRQALYAIRRAMEPVDTLVLRVTEETVRLEQNALTVDVVAFEEALAKATPDTLAAAADLYQGELLDGLAVSAPGFDEWLVAERERLHEQAVEGLARLLTARRAAGDLEAAIKTALRLLALEPLQEAVHRSLMRLYAGQGRRGAALKQYQACVSVLQRELGTTPEPETKELYQDLLRGQNSPGQPAGVALSVEVSEPRRPARQTPPATTDLPAMETPLFGREAELERLHGVLRGVLRKRSHLVTVVGEAGIGKTRLVNALLSGAEGQCCRVVVGRCHESDTILSFGPWMDALRSSQVSSDFDVLHALPPRWRAELSRLLPEASEPGLPATSDSALPLFESVAQLIEQAATRQPLVVVLEDLHWADEMSLRLLAFVSRRIPAWPVLLIATARREELAQASMARRTIEDLSHLANGMSIELSPLSRADTVRLVRALGCIGRDAPPAQLEEQIWSMSEGNPFVTVEAMRAFGADGGSDEIRDTPRRLALPGRVRELVVRHLERLSERTQNVAAVAAVIGRRFDFGLLHAASGMDERAAAEAVEEMVRHHVLEAVGSQLDFAHDRIRAVAYDRLLGLRQGLLHRAVVEALESVDRSTVPDTETPPGKPVGERIEQLAHHAVRGEMWDRAVRYCQEAGAKSAARLAYREAAAFFAQALAARKHLPDAALTRQHSADLLIDLGIARRVLGEWSRALDCFRQAEILAEALGNHQQLGEIALHVTSLFWHMAEHDRALEAGRRSLALATGRDDPGHLSGSRCLLGRIHYARGEYRDAIHMFGQCPAIPSGGRLREEFRAERNGLRAVRARAELALCLAEIGEFTEAVARGEEAHQLAEAIGRPSCRIVACVGLGGVWMSRRDLARAIPVLESGFLLCEESQIPVVLPWIASYFARAIGLAGRVDEARPLLERAIERAAAMQLLVYQSQRIAWLGEIAIFSGLHDEALELGKGALELARKYGERGHEAWTLRLLGKVHSTGGGASVRRAAEYYRQALTIADELGMRPLVAHCHHGLGKLYRRTGQREQAQEHLTTALTMYREMGMTYWLEQAEAEIGELE